MWNRTHMMDVHSSLQPHIPLPFLSWAECAMNIDVVPLKKLVGILGLHRVHSALLDT